MRAVLHIISDQQRAPRHSLAESLALAALGGADVLQIRQKRAPAGDTYTLAREVQDHCRKLGVSPQLLINDRIDVASAVSADGVHLAARSLPVHAVVELRRRGQFSGRIGCSVHSLEEAHDASAAGVDYITFGHVFATSSHVGAPPRGLVALAEIVNEIPLPVIAIGGITVANVAEVLLTGCSGVAVIGAVLDQLNPELAARMLTREMARSAVVPRRHFF